MEIVVEERWEIPKPEELQDILNAKYSFENLMIRAVVSVQSSAEQSENGEDLTSHLFVYHKIPT